ncbi:MAG: 50S ribosomal protein L21 [Bacteroidetes bacterium]|jgi:large subunit ribosomal protein L21|nr:50S ribosomal protein L21 [Bacteroidota bacterium]MBT5527706.1 50S ribosomal protein L21 [Cytophagia bacterium]MBT3800042.1 50S ribosomal protein L21 [Bacteroidota bacterium]MBT3933600.1 50S ribosomal protein L21 [Bacteroidota bacterium]MBT4339876.1 50S ribosomal protein L21 [Bacteroidota bacterium]
MYAIVDITGHQYKVEKDQTLLVNQVEGKAGDSIEFSKVLLSDNDGKVKIGTPSIKGAKVTATIVEQMKGEKVIVFKKKRRKGYRVKNGHRQLLSKIQITEIKN